MADDEKKLEHINVKVVGQDNNEVFFKIKRTTNLRKLMEAYCDKMGKKFGTLKFMFDGQRVDPNQTADDISLENDDSIEVHLEQTGGLFQTARPYLL